MAHRCYCKICGTLMDLRKRHSYVQTYGSQRTYGGSSDSLACTDCSKSKYAGLLRSHWASLDKAEDQLHEMFEKTASNMIKQWKKESQNNVP